MSIPAQFGLTTSKDLEIPPWDRRFFPLITFAFPSVKQAEVTADQIQSLKRGLRTKPQPSVKVVDCGSDQTQLRVLNTPKFKRPHHSTCWDPNTVETDEQPDRLGVPAQPQLLAGMYARPRGLPLNEHVNGLVRKYFPKGTDFRSVTPNQVKEVENRINNRPRKVLNYLTPQEAFLMAMN